MNNGKLLIGWGEIASVLRVSIVTARFYEKKRGLPIIRDPAGHPTIYEAQIDVWRRYKIPDDFAELSEFQEQQQEIKFKPILRKSKAL